DEVYTHLICNGVDPGIKEWYFSESGSHSAQNENREFMHDDIEMGHPLGRRKGGKKGAFSLDSNTQRLAHRYVIFNCQDELVEKYIKMVSIPNDDDENSWTREGVPPIVLDYPVENQETNSESYDTVGNDTPTTATANISQMGRTNEWKPSFAVAEVGIPHQACVCPALANDRFHGDSDVRLIGDDASMTNNSNEHIYLCQQQMLAQVIAFPYMLPNMMVPCADVPNVTIPGVLVNTLPRPTLDSNHVSTCFVCLDGNESSKFLKPIGKELKKIKLAKRKHHGKSKIKKKHNLKMSNYEMQRLKRMAENQRRMEELGLKTLAYEVSRKDQKRREISKVISKDDVANDDEYIPDEEEHEPRKSSNENGAQHRRRLSSRSKKVVAVKGSSHNGLEKPQSSMASLLNMHRQTPGVQEKLRKDDNEKEMDSLEMVQRDTAGENEHSKQVTWTERLSRPATVMRSKLQGKDVISNSSKKTAQSKILVSPGSIGAYARMRRNSTAEKEPQTIIDSVPRKQGHLFDDVGGTGVSIVEENEAYESLHEYVAEGEDDMNPKEIEDDAVEIENEPFSDQERHNLPVEKKRTRGPSLCKDIHERTIENRLPIILNESCQPIGPDKTTLDKFSRFLGTLARNSNLAPLNEINWTHVHDKDKIWEYVKKKFIIAEEGKTYVLQSIGALWRTHKSRVKKKYYYNSSSKDINGENKSIPDSHMKDLLKYWDLEEV
ncbi:plant transposase, partial [Striga asiatica]